MAEVAAPARENLIFLPEWTMIPLYALFAVAMGILIWGFWQRIQVYRSGRKAGNLPNWKTGLKDVLSLVLGQSKTRRKPFAGPMHSAIFYGFIALLIGTILVGIDQDIAEPLGYKLLTGSFYLWYEVTLDVFGAFFIIGLLFAAYRRTFIKPKSLQTRRTDTIALWLFGLIGITGYLIESLRLYLKPVEWGQWSVVGWNMRPMYGAFDVSREAFGSGEHLYIGIWWVHALLVFAFIAMIPFTKMVHILTATANAATRTQKTAPGQLSKPFDLMELVEKGEFEFEMGANKPVEFTWKQLMMVDSCTNCGRCEDVCPATAAGRPLSPRVLIQDINHAAFGGASVPPAFGRAASTGPGAMGEEAWLEYETACRKDRGDGKPIGHAPIMDNVVQAETLWSCTTCRACEEACPVVIEHVGLIVDMRRQLMMEGKAKKHQRETIEKMATTKNPWGLPPSDRMDWTKDLAKVGIRVHELSEKGTADGLDVVFWVGCSGASDPRNQRIAQAMARILDHAELEWAVLGREETCTGDPARRMGEEGRFQELAFENIAKFDAYNIKSVVTTCPHCFNTLKNEYPDFGWKDAKVEHHTEFIDRLMKEGKIRPESDVGLDTIAYHDSCYIGRHNGIYDQPRDVLNRLPGLKVVEAEGACKEKGRCCGAGGANMFYEVEEQQRMSNIRLSELTETKADAVASNCPFCMTMFEDAKNNVAPDTGIHDIAELVALSLPAAKGASAPADDAPTAPETPPVAAASGAADGSEVESEVEATLITPT